MVAVGAQIAKAESAEKLRFWIELVEQTRHLGLNALKTIEKLTSGYV